MRPWCNAAWWGPGATPLGGALVQRRLEGQWCDVTWRGPAATRLGEAPLRRRLKIRIALFNFQINGFSIEAYEFQKFYCIP